MSTSIKVKTLLIQLIMLENFVQVYRRVVIYVQAVIIRSIQEVEEAQQFQYSH